MNKLIELISLCIGFIVLVIAIIAGYMDKGGNDCKVVVGAGSNNKANTNLMIFHRDLRCIDNTALDIASKNADNVICVFIFDDAQIGASNSYRSVASINFMIESIEELNAELNNNLLICKGDTATIVEELIKENNIKGVYFNADYTPFAVSRTKKIKDICEKYSVTVECPHDVLILDGNVELYLKFTPFHNRYAGAKIRIPGTSKPKNIIAVSDVSDVSGVSVNMSNKTTLDTIRKIINSNGDNNGNNNGNNDTIKGGRSRGLEILASIKKHSTYNNDRDMLAYPTTRLSAHNKFGTVSCREVYYAFSTLPLSSKDLTKQMFWRDFYYTLMINDPNALKGAYNSKYNTDAIWLDEPIQKKHFDAWKTATTGYPVIDACMRELNSNHYMHNRGRMIVADFLIKLLGVNWQTGEKYFAQQLVDYDPAQNNYNWQWVAGTGPFSQPAFRVFNPRSQSENFDPNCEYIRKWCPELKDVSCDDIHNWDIAYTKYINEGGASNAEGVKYPAPIINYITARSEYLQRIKKAK